VTAEGSFADGSDARDGDRTGDTSDGENADDTDDPDGGIDFDEPFDEGIDVLDSRPDSGPVPDRTRIRRQIRTRNRPIPVSERTPTAG